MSLGVDRDEVIGTSGGPNIIIDHYDEYHVLSWESDIEFRDILEAWLTAEFVTDPERQTQVVIEGSDKRIEGEISEVDRDTLAQITHGNLFRINTAEYNLVWELEAESNRIAVIAASPPEGLLETIYEDTTGTGVSQEMKKDLRDKTV